MLKLNHDQSYLVGHAIATIRDNEDLRLDEDEWGELDFLADELPHGGNHTLDGVAERVVRKILDLYRPYHDLMTRLIG